MSLSVIPLTILGQITGVSGSGDTVLYQVSFKSIDGTSLYGVTAVWTDEQAEIEALAAQKPYGVWINPIDGTFTVKFAGYTYVGSADLTDPDVLAGITPIEFANQSGGGSLPVVTDADNGKVLAVVNGAWDKSDVHSIISEPETLFDGTITITAEDVDGVEIPFDMDVSSYPFKEWSVTINGFEIPYQAADNAFILESDNIGYNVFDNDGVYTLQVVNIQDENYPPVPGNYQVKIVAQARGGSSGLPDVSASDNGSVLGVINGEWGVDDRLKDYPSISNNDGAVLGFGVDRDGNRIAQSIVPAPMNYSQYKSNAFYLPFKGNNERQPRYISVSLDARPASQNYMATSVLVDKAGEAEESFVFDTALLPLTVTGTYTLKANVDNGLVSFHWVKDT